MKKTYLYVKLEGHEGIAFFKNENKEGKQPDYKSKGGAGCWVREYEDKQNETIEEVKGSGL